MIYKGCDLEKGEGKRKDVELHPGDATQIECLALHQKMSKECFQRK